MALIHTVRWSLLSALTIATLLSCGSPSREPEQPAEPSAPFRQAAAPDLSPSKGGGPAGALPSQVVSGEVAAFKATSAKAGPEKTREAAGSLPSNATAGTSAAYAPQGRAEPSPPRTPPARMATP